MSKVKRYNPSIRSNTKLTGMLLYLLPTPILFAIIISFFTSSGISIIKYSIAYALFILGARVAKRGFDFEREYKKSALAKAPRFPYKTAGAIIISFATFFTSLFCVDNNLLFSIVVALSALIGFYLFYGFDPREDKLGGLSVGVRAEDVIEVTDEAKTKVAKLELISKELPRGDMRDSLEDIISQTREIISGVESDPNDLSKARKFFKIYLDRAYKISDEFVKHLKKETLSEEIKDSYKNLLNSLQKTIVEQKNRLDSEDLMSLDVQIEALTKQLNQEGV